VADAGICPGELVLDIGAGAGALTDPLVRAGARVVAVELHPDRAAALRRRWDRDAVTVVEVDAGDLWLPRRAFRVVANPPYARLAAITGRLLAPGSRLQAADLVVPRWFARSVADGELAGAGRWSRTWSAERGRPVPPGAFSPPARQGAEVLRIRRR